MAIKRKRSPGRPRRDLVKVSLAMNIKPLALAEEIAEAHEKSRIAVMEEAINEYAQKRGFTMTDERARELLGVEKEEDEES